MSGFEKISIKRTASGIMAIMMFVIMLLAHIYIASETDHDCAGEDCPICACIQQCENTINQIGIGTSMQLSVLIPLLFLVFITFLSEYPIQTETPVLLKVRLNN